MAYCSLFFASNLVIFFFLFNVDDRSIHVTRAFFVWVNVFNMFIVSLFWSLMNDIYSRAQSKRLFAFIAAGGTAGAISGPIITTSLVKTLGLAPLILLSGFVLSLSVFCINFLTNWQNDEFQDSEQELQKRKQSLKGGLLDGVTLILSSRYLLGICLFISLYAMSITFVEIQQATIVQNTISDPASRTQLFSGIDFAVNVLALIFQLFLTSRIIEKLGYRLTLMLIPIGITIGFAAMAVSPILSVMIAIEVFRRAGDYAIMKPAREMLFTVLSREEKYKAKNFIDTTILRGGNMASAQIFVGLKSLGVAGASMAGASLLLAASWTATAYWLGGQFDKKKHQLPKST